MECLTGLWSFAYYVQLQELTALVRRLINDDSKLRRWPVSSLVAAVEMDYLFIHQGLNRSYIEMQKYHVAYSVAGDLIVDKVTMSNRAAMMQFYVEDSVMPEPVVEGG
ncbi:uncharacterized protein Bfra_003184 [Botrytis fragariae]|uniref:Uncharacterized protein n=1 Tax=Botrytis fragariae TaxID=1964551 RepID=A0A8H6B068_9HELO|nr:uncharacterized protein Bfra_003184 [Botrytis fragariae]KAF5876778.1 hypothetical protein Bfra_003184 [Botrytis fragariae]